MFCSPLLQLFATEKTAKYLQDHNIPASTVAWPLAVMEEEEREYPPATRYYKTVVDELLNNLLKNSFQITTDACRRNGALACNFLHLVSSPFSNLPDTNKGFEVVKLFAEALDEVGNLDASTLFHFTKPSGSNFSKEALLMNS
ncbi:Carbamoyl-phosphate synthase [ammonia], mitochondrial [Holothuria leucospilota]|uniref:Carbamoyl-phosphate synthase [ammonia], mitochondrial n=1 Tax=Holothuria leucospilota TaxID=206669 RepID=A0A9Q0YCE8_HOLLE|nr:Carbamoyl-phosphate synthase [ammonia], mitochondrial [Holothuria leucospilota]